MDMETTVEFKDPGHLQSAEIFLDLKQLLEQRSEYITPARRTEFETRVVSTQYELILALFETAVAQLNPGRIPEFELLITQKLTETIEQLAKQANTSSNGGWVTISEQWLGLRARAARTERQLDLKVCPDPQDFEASVRWAAERGEKQELHLLQQAECQALADSEQGNRLIEVAIQRINERGHQLDLQIEKIRDFRQHPIEALRATTIVGQSAAAARKGKPEPHLFSVEGYDPVAALREILAEAPSPSLRSEAAWALGQIGGLQAARELLSQLEAIFVSPEMPDGEVACAQDQQEMKAVCASLVQALDTALDKATLDAFVLHDRQLLRRVYEALLDHLLTQQKPDPDFSTALATSLARVGLRAPSQAPDDALERLLNAPEPVATLATVASLREWLHHLRLQSVLAYIHDAVPDETIDAAFDALGRKRGRPYHREERMRLLDVVARFWHAHRDKWNTFEYAQDAI